jgi:predicted secreted protein
MANNIENLFYVVLVIFLLATKLELVNSQKTVSFSFSDFKTKKSSLILQGSAQISASGVLELTDANYANYQVSRALYTTPVPLWDRATGNVASFQTTFSFTIVDIDIGSLTPADGFIFFLAPDGSIPVNNHGGNLGVVDGNKAYNNFVGVEFDNYVNEWDPSYPHIGIDVSSMKSLKYEKWNRVSNKLVDVTIIYDSKSQTLSVVLKDQDGQFATVAQVVDFRYVLPETVRVGFSASSTAHRQMHNIHSWSFRSILGTTISSTSSKNVSSY